MSAKTGPTVGAVRRMTASLALLAIVAAACGGASTAEDGPALVVLADNGTVRTVGLDGTVEVLAGQPDDGVARFQPIWTPDGKGITFSEVGPDGAALVQVALDEDRTVRAELATRPFYFYWDPTGARVATLRDGGDGSLVLELVDDDGNVDVAGSGQPFYYSWEPTGDSLVTHRGARPIEVISDTEIVVIDDRGGEFQATWWTEEGIWYVRRATGSQRVALVSPGEPPQDLAEVLGFVHLSPSPTGDQVAVQSLVQRQEGQSAALQALPRLTANRLSVIDVDTLTVQEATQGGVGAFFWSPDGSRLLLLDSGSSEGTLRWLIWSEEGMRSFADFIPSATSLQDFLGFFDQYAQSMSLWSPDSSAFAFAGTVEGSSGVFIQHLDDDVLERVTDGVWVAWSPVVGDR